MRKREEEPMSDGRPDSETVVVVCLDGVSWDYVEAADTPFLDSMGREGVAATCIAMVPTVTNVNTASIITGAFPEEHGISTNWYYDPATGVEVYMDSSRFLTCKTLLERETARGGRTLLLTVKDKLRRLLARNVTASYSTEKPPPRLVEELGAPPPIYSIESSPWLLTAAKHELGKRRWEMVYISTTDYIPHMYAPNTPEAREYMHRLDEGLEGIAEQGVVLGVVADHGMNSKTVNLDLIWLLEKAGIGARFVAAIKDEHVIHHQNLGGSAYLYVDGDVEKARDVVASADGVEAALTRAEAAARFRLPANRIGDLLVLADADHTFGPNPRSVYADVEVRSHGSLQEREVPFILSRRVDIGLKLYNKDVIPALTASSLH